MFRAEHFQYKNHVSFSYIWIKSNEHQNFCTMEDLLFTLFVYIYTHTRIYMDKHIFKVSEAYTIDSCSATKE